MKWFYNLKIAKKLIATFFVVILLVFALGFFAIQQLSKVNAASSDLAVNWLPSIRTLSSIQLTMARIRGSEAQQILLQDPALMGKNRDGTVKLIATLQRLQKTYEGLITRTEEKNIYQGIATSIDNFLVTHNKIIELSMGGKKDEAQAVNVGSSAAYVAAIASIEKAVGLNETGAEDSNAAAGVIYDRAITGIIVLLAVCAALALFLSLWLARLISRPLNDAVAAAQRIAEGDLSTTIESSSKDETGQLMHALKAMNDSLFNIVGEVHQGTEAIDVAAREIAQGNLDLSSRTEEQAGSLEETAAAMEELTSTVKQNAENALQANVLAESASEVASRGGSVVDQVISTMNEINSSSNKIVEIISVIDGIAFQTNILALNAAVEAARAGEQGRGFAVVASEVRSLAQRSAAAAKEIKELINASVANVGNGSKLVEQAGETMKEVVASVRRVTDIVSEISASSREQSTGIEQVNQAVILMDDVTQQNAALVEEAAAAAGSLQDQAQRLTGTVSVFKLSSSAIAVAGAVKKFAPKIAPAVAASPRKPAAPIRKQTAVASSSGSAAMKKDEKESWEEF
ncbi:methyl-accepting chemotaxis protein [Herbaspirillum sp. RTI4]|uniref:methyl-accepting chemotaxis protein n=1 Tax=Herbaspirillum sp. RTI4 TaxID=3048640 RepID=UPI002AB3DCB0|nr:methyl-accepting chemotaxis protein [Herbaspirillum sp. RTI4]MDY7578095.1 methyl-accepting chemotaxis protein [Herbaspirillum sp. RTI4]MEA9980684.1 methyl-accepting chemotaxis protein [Herbaspirillum sp. RTI4]